MLTLRYLLRDSETALIVAYYVRFSGDTTDEFLTFKDLVKQQRNSCRWAKGAYEGKGAWWMTGSLLARYREFFDNYEQMVAQAEDDYQEVMEARKEQQRQLSTNRYAIPRATVETLADALRILGFRSLPTAEEARKRWIALMRTHHEDKGGEHVEATRINLSYAYLKQFFTQPT